MRSRTSELRFFHEQRQPIDLRAEFRDAELDFAVECRDALLAVDVHLRDLLVARRLRLRLGLLAVHLLLEFLHRRFGVLDLRILRGELLRHLRIRRALRLRRQHLENRRREHDLRAVRHLVVPWPVLVLQEQVAKPRHKRRFRADQVADDRRLFVASCVERARRLDDDVEVRALGQRVLLRRLPALRTHHRLRRRSNLRIR